MTEQEIAGIVERMAELDEEITARQGEQAMLWKRIYEMADEIAGAEQAWRWVHPTLKRTIGRTMAENSPQLDQAVLQGWVTDEQWQICTKQVRTFDLERLTAAVAAGTIDKTDVEEATSQKPPTTRKHWKVASKDELAALAERVAGG